MHDDIPCRFQSKKVNLGFSKKNEAERSNGGGYTKLGTTRDASREYLNYLGADQKMTKRYALFKSEQKKTAELALTLTESTCDTKFLQVSTNENNPYHGQFSQLSLEEEGGEQAPPEEIKAGSIALKKAPTFGTIEGEDGMTRKAFTVNQKMTLQNRNVKLLSKAIPPLMIVRNLFFEVSESFDTGGQKYEAFDPITRRYLDYCLFSG
mmetsp:Transcript_16745/g.25806  ORF Transcript_16745/g.25806 Transcript_16745/m.25806 type:complete len:208 (+) Transcript_16745:1032-1655(+)